MNADTAAAFDRARPPYSEDAVEWMTGGRDRMLLELAAGTGGLTEVLVRSGNRVIATDPQPELLARLRERVVPYAVGVSSAETIPAPSRSIDVVICGDTIHRFDYARAMPEIARVLKPGGFLAMANTRRDTGIPWVRKLGALFGEEPDHPLFSATRMSVFFGSVEERDFRSWQKLNREGVVDLTLSRPAVLAKSQAEQDEIVAAVLALYDDYGRGPDGLLLPYITRCYRAAVIHASEPPPSTEDDMAASFDDHDLALPDGLEPGADSDGPGTLLIDFK